MSQAPDQNRNNLINTLYITLYLRALESQRPDALVRDLRAEAIARQLDPAALEKTLKLTEATGRLVMILKSLDFDQITRAFLAQNPQAVVVQLGSGLDTRFERVDDGQVVWYDLDFPEVIELRQKFIGDEGPRHHHLACSVLDPAWIDELRALRQRPFLCLAEGLFFYLDEAEVMSLVLSLQQHFPGAELVFDAYSPFMRWAHNEKVWRTRVGAPLHWALHQARDLEQWRPGIRLLDARYPFQYPEPRLRRSVKLRLIPAIGRGIGVFHYQL